MNNQKYLLRKIKNKKASIAVIGLGYVGLPLAILLVKSGFIVNGYVRTKKKVSLLHNGISEIGFDKQLKKIIKTNKISFYDIKDNSLQDNDIYIICVPTPVHTNKKPDLSSLKQISKRLATIDLTNKLIINESTVAPFTTREIFGSLLGEFFLVCSPERIDPGSNKTVEHIPKVVGGINKDSLELGKTLYDLILNDKTVPVANMEIAEMAKMLENTYRAVNIAFINEFAKLAESLNIDIMSVIDAAKSKWSYQAHYPSIGVGGHCIPVDPHYLLELAKKKKTEMKIVTEALITNEKMPEHIAEKILRKYKKGMTVTIYGITYKKDVADLRESPVLKLCDLLTKSGISFTVYDPFFNKESIEKLGYNFAEFKAVDIFVVGTNHKELINDYKPFVAKNTTIIDGRNFFYANVGKEVLGVGRSIK